MVYKAEDKTAHWNTEAGALGKFMEQTKRTKRFSMENLQKGVGNWKETQQESL